MPSIQNASLLSRQLLIAGLALFFSGVLLAQQEPLLNLGAELEELKQDTQPDVLKQPEIATKMSASDMKVTKVEPIQKVKKESAHPPHWSYSGDEGPEHWGLLSPEFATCMTGKNQSPIDLRDKKAIGTQGLAELDIRYKDVPLRVVNNGHTVQVNYPLGSYIKIGDKRYELLQFHFHTPSEHKKEGFNYPMEVHLVHKDGDGNLAVIAVIFQEGEENEALNTLLRVLPEKKGKEKLYPKLSLNPVHFFPGNTEFYKYSGSLTTPPCTEGVYWMVFKHPIELSAVQLQQMQQVLGNNARPVNSWNARDLLKSWSEPVEEQRMYEYY